MKSLELTDVQSFYLMGHLDGDHKELAKALGLKPLTVKKFLAANRPKPPEVTNSPLSPQAAEIMPDRFQPARDLMGRTTGEGKQRGVAIMTGGASMAGDDARKAVRESSGEIDDSSYVFRFDVKRPVTGPVVR